MKNPIALLSSLLLVVLLAPTAYAQNANSPYLKRIKWIQGTWSGVGYQEAMKAEWDIELKCNVQTGDFKISYPSISCSGIWELKNANGYRAEFLEVIQEEQDNCGDVVRVVVTRIEDRFISVAFFLPEVDDTVAAYTVLTQVNPSKTKAD